MKIRILASALMLAVGLASAVDAQAQRRERSQFGEEDAIVLQPNRAYIFFRTPYRESYRFLREVTESERAAHEAAREAAYTRARTRAERRLREWQRNREACGSGSIAPLCRQPRPDVPTPATFPFAPPEADNFVGNTFRPRLIHNEDWSGWLIAVEPGTYALYGAISETQNGLMGTCFCMGSVRFEARAGEITDMGEVLMVPESERGSPTAQNFRLGHYITVAPWTSSMRTPQQFANLRVVPAQLRAADRMPNYFGVMITRLAPVEGVLAYNRDEVIDVRAGATAQGSGQ